MMPMHRRSRALVLALVVVFLVGGCFARPVRRPVYRDGGIQVFLRSEKRLTQVVEKEFSHPVTIAAVRMGHILSRIDIRTDADDGNDRLPAIPTEILFSAAEGIVKALAEATPDEEVVVMSMHKTKRFYLFDRNYLTSFIIYARGEHLFVHLSRTDWEVPPRRKDRLPEPHIGDHPMDFRVFPSTAMAQTDRQGLAIDWQDPVFRNPSRTRISPGGEVVRSEILMESPREDWAEDAPSIDENALENLSPDQLRALAHLEQQRRRGLVTEADYRGQRRRILEP